MSTHELETLYWRISLLFIAVSPWCIYHLKTIKVAFAYNGFIYILIPLLTVPLQLLVTTILVSLTGSKMPGKFWIVEPSTSAKNQVKAHSLKACVSNVTDKLSSLGFQFEIDQTLKDYICINFRKDKEKPIHTFLGHSFSGRIYLQKQNNSMIEIEAQVRLHDTIVIETGDLSKIQELCNLFCLNINATTQKDFSFSLSCGLTLAFLTIIVILIDSFISIINNAFLFGLCTTAIGTILLTTNELLRKKQGSFTYRLVFTGLYLASIPYLAWMTNLRF
jgi:hypothetical protein